ncbi:hypothetical protein CIB95_15590 [Lottiidibacillus patelloidae]|uniref:Uncharacterized protein n=1 Tax=Lottiidibacillus patelloidae TaxID=2670334 RepID=A0A263BPV0_9BACI|nr:hypothetical protein [Lottiidibacillus patelloidae]OZM55784.1 hypothetical protein CIB95_15590 [Lottiidibacillus patelloidae]
MWNVSFNIVGFVFFVLAWLSVALIAFRIYNNLAGKPKVWKVALVIIVGMFSFSINWSAFDTVFQISILPLGVWILYAVLKGKEGKWQTYRLFAWLGFWANFIFLAATLVSSPIHATIYPADRPTTYLADITNASVVTSHPSGKSEVSLNKEALISELDQLSREMIMNIEWYNETYRNNMDSNKKEERFPYLLINYQEKWGSGMESTIYIENDGKGILISSAGKQYYFRSNNSILKEGGHGK